MAIKRKKRARPGYYPCGKKRPVELGATPQLLEHKKLATGSDVLEISPLGILSGRGLVSDEQVEGARRFRICHNAVWSEIGGPRLGSGTLSWVVSDPGAEDQDIAMARIQRGSKEAMLDRAFETYMATIVRDPSRMKGGRFTG